LGVISPDLRLLYVASRTLPARIATGSADLLWSRLLLWWCSSSLWGALGSCRKGKMTRNGFEQP